MFRIRLREAPRIFFEIPWGKSLLRNVGSSFQKFIFEILYSDKSTQVGLGIF